VKKKNTVSQKDKKDWIAFTKEMGDLNPKEEDLINKNNQKDKVPKLDLHGYSLTEANKQTKKFIIKHFEKGYKKLLIVTGKGSRSKSYNDPYQSEKLSMLRYSVPEYIKMDPDFLDKINRITQANKKDGGEGAVYIFLKKL